MKLEAFSVIIDRGRVLDDFTIDFNDGRGPIGFASMTPEHQALIIARLPSKQRVTFTPVAPASGNILDVVYEVTRETIGG